jgi:hypothetical protein
MKCRRRNDDEETLAEIGRNYNVSGATISRLALAPIARPKPN